MSKLVVAIAVSALICGMCASSVSAKQRQPHRARVVAPKVETMKSVPGNNPFTIARNTSDPKAKYDAPKAVPGNNPMPILKPR